MHLHSSIVIVCTLRLRHSQWWVLSTQKPHSGHSECQVITSLKDRRDFAGQCAPWGALGSLANSEGVWTFLMAGCVQTSRVFCVCVVVVALFALSLSAASVASTRTQGDTASKDTLSLSLFLVEWANEWKLQDELKNNRPASNNLKALDIC